MSPREQILQQALQLTPEDRAYLADLLEESLPAPRHPSEDIAAAWSREIDRRIAAYDRHETTALSFESAVAHARQALSEHRERRAGT